MSPIGPYKSEWSTRPVYIVAVNDYFVAVAEGFLPEAGQTHKSVSEAKRWLAANGFRLQTPPH